jgi:hypothetical protein
MSVSMVAAPWRRFTQAARWKGYAPHTTTGAARVSDSHCQLSNWSAGTMAMATTGMLSRSEISRRLRRGAVSSTWVVASLSPASTEGRSTRGSAAV